MEKRKRNWKAKYMLQSDWLNFRNHEWKLLNWKVDVTLGLLLIILAVALVKLFD